MTTYNDFVIRFANVNGSGSASANGMFAKALFRMGIPVATRNIFPSNIEGLPTWFEVRVSERGYLGRREGIDIMVAMNAETFEEDIASIVPGGYLVYDNSKELRPNFRRDDINLVGIPISQLVLPEFPNPKHRALFKNIVYLGALSALLNIDFDIIKGMVSAQFKGKDELIAPNIHAMELGRSYAREYLQCPLPIQVRHSDAVGDRIMIDGNAAAAIGAIYGGATVCAWYPITPSTSLAEAFEQHCARLRVDPETGERRYAIIQAEDELAAMGIVIGAGWNGARSFTATSGPGVSLMTEFLGLAYFAEIPAVLWDIQRAGPSTGMPTRTQQGDLVFLCVSPRTATPAHPLMFPSTPRECFDFGADALDLADRLQTPIIVMSDLELGMNDKPLRALHLGRPPAATTAARCSPRKTSTTWRRFQPLPRRGRRRRRLSHAAGHARGEGRLLHPRHVPRRARHLHRAAGALHQEHGSAAAQVGNRARTRAEGRDRGRTGRRAGILYYGTTAAPMQEALDRLAEGRRAARHHAHFAASRSATRCASSSTATKFLFPRRTETATHR